MGGGPAGSSCARVLRAAGWDVVVADKARFPRDKVCAGWITPKVLELLELDPAEYRATGLTFQQITGFRTGVLSRQGDLTQRREGAISHLTQRREGAKMVETRYNAVVSYAIRRCEFDHFLLQRADVRVVENTPVERIERRGDTWIVNGTIETPVLVGAGGHFCPVARHLQGHPDEVQAVVAQELEFPLDGHHSSVNAESPELFFSRDFEGYGWCVRKGDFLNVGIGRRSREGFNQHARAFMTFLCETGRAPEPSRASWHGHAYHAAGAGVRPLIGDGVIVAGDAAGLAYPESGEGIRPAIESGILAARTLVGADGRRTRDDLAPYESAVRERHPPPSQTPPWLRPAVNALGRALMRSHAFTSRVVIDRWFLRRHTTDRADRAERATNS